MLSYVLYAEILLQRNQKYAADEAIAAIKKNHDKNKDFHLLKRKTINTSNVAGEVGIKRE